MHSFHWVSSILFLGPPRIQSAEHWENFHQPIKHFAEQSNSKSMYKSIMKSVCLHTPSHNKTTKTNSKQYNKMLGWKYAGKIPEQEVYNKINSHTRQEQQYNKNSLVGRLGVTQFLHWRYKALLTHSFVGLSCADQVSKVTSYRGTFFLSNLCSPTTNNPTF